MKPFLSSTSPSEKRSPSVLIGIEKVLSDGARKSFLRRNSPDFFVKELPSWQLALENTSLLMES
jgi:hypothetical protein